MIEIKKILILSNLCIGGVETFSIYLAKALKQKGYDVIFINQDEISRGDERFSESLELTLINDNIPIISVKDSFNEKYFSSNSRYIIPFYATKYLEAFYSNVLKNNLLPVLYGYIHSDGAYYYDNAFLYESITSNFICVSESIEVNLSEILNEKEKLTYKKCPLLLKADAQNNSNQSNHLKLLFVGRINDEPKGVFKLVEIASYLEENGVPFVMDIVGNGLDIEELKERFLKAKITSKITFVTDANTPEKVVPYYEFADVLLILSSYEGGPLVLYEAMEFGTIPVGFNVGVMNQLIENGINGYVFEHNQFNLLLKQIKILSKNKNKSKIKKKAINTVRNLNMGMDDYISFVEELFTQKTQKQYADVAIRKTNSKIKWKDNDLQSWISRILSESTLKRNHIFHYLFLTQNNIELKKQLEVQKHYQSVYDDMPMFWKKLGSIIRKFKSL